MDRTFVIENRRSQERVRRVIKSLTDEELNLPLNKEGWTVAVALSHMAFWDMRRLVLLPKWKKEGVSPSIMDSDTVNDTLVPFFLLIPPRKAAELALSTAELLDREIEGLPDELVATILQTSDPHALDRSAHRNSHLDDIENLLKYRR